MSTPPTDDRTRLLRYLDGSLPADAARRLERRLDAEPDLHAQLDRLRRLEHTLQAHTARSFDDDFARRVMDRLPASPSPDGAMALYDALQRLFVRVAVACLVAIGVLGGLNVAQYQDADAAVSVVEAAFGLPDASVEDVFDPPVVDVAPDATDNTTDDA